MNASAHAMFVLFILVEAAQGCDLWAAGSGASKGKRLYEEHCMVCHGSTGKGDGYRLFNPPPADLTSPASREKLDAALLRTIHEGRPNTAMGTWKYVLSDEEAGEVLAYVRSFPR